MQSEERKKYTRREKTRSFSAESLPNWAFSLKTFFPCTHHSAWCVCVCALFPPLYLGRVISIPVVFRAQLTVRHTLCCHCVSLLLHQADRAAHICAHCCLPFCACHHIYLTSTMLLCSTCELFTSVSALACATHISMKKRGEWEREREKKAFSEDLQIFYLHKTCCCLHSERHTTHGEMEGEMRKSEKVKHYFAVFSRMYPSTNGEWAFYWLFCFFPPLLLLDFSCHLRLFLLLFFSRVWAWDEGVGGKRTKGKVKV